MLLIFFSALKKYIDVYKKFHLIAMLSYFNAFVCNANIFCP